MENKNTVDEMPFPAIPERWCMKRTPENAEILNAWVYSRFPLAEGDHEFKAEKLYVYDNKSWDFVSGNHGSIIITFEQWQTIPEVAEWLKESAWKEFCMVTENDHLEVEEREIIGYEAPCDIPEWETEKGDIWVKHEKFDCYKSQSKSVNLPKEWVETWKPVYREKPGLFHKIVRLATPEEIEAARPKEVWEKYPTPESIPDSPVNYNIGEVRLPDLFQVHFIRSFIDLKKVERAWNEGKKGFFTIQYNEEDGLWVSNTEGGTEKAQINFLTYRMAEKSLELHGDLWRKYHMV